jgi:hypothetical protein
MAENKTKPTSKSVASYLAEIEDPLLDLETIAINMPVEDLDVLRTLISTSIERLKKNQ